MRIVALLAAVLLSLWLGVRAAEPPAVVPSDAPASIFSAARALTDVHAVAVRPHPTLSQDNARVRLYLAQRLRALGLAVEERRYLIDQRGIDTLAHWTGRQFGGGEMVDLVGVLPGRDRTLPAVALMAHYDTVWGSPGGGDDSIGLATILETLRSVRARGVPARDIVVLFTDGEEIGMSGARAFWAGDGGVASHVGVVLNFEARGAGGRAAMFETGADNGGMMALFADAVPRPVANSMAVMAYRLMPNYTDFTVTKARGLPGFNFAILGRAQYYHSPRATSDRLDPRSLQDMGDQATALTAALAFAKLLPAPSPDSVFFDWRGRGLVHYGLGTGWLLLLGAALAWGAAWIRARPGLAEIGWGAGAQIWMLLQAWLAIASLNRVSAGPHPQYYDRLAALPRLEMMVLFAALAALVAAAGFRRVPIRIGGIVAPLALLVLGRAAGLPLSLVLGCALPAMALGWFAPAQGLSRWGGWLGALLPLLLAVLVMQAKAPMAAWLVAWPALIAACTAALVAWTDREGRWPWGWAIACAGAVLVGSLLLPIAHIAFLGIGAAYPQAIAVAMLLPVAAAFWPLTRIEGAGRITLIAVAALLIAAGGTALQIRSAPLAETVPAYAPDK
jgi:hypothetical protein